MSYQQHNVTMLDDLPSLDEMENSGRSAPLDPQIMDRPEANDDKYMKYIRGNHRMMDQSGMDQMGPHPGYQQVGPPQLPREYHPPQLAQNSPHIQFNCIDIARHITDCPICSKFYNNDKTVYIIAIILLSIVCILLLKRVLNV
jgi:hypothetical protein